MCLVANQFKVNKGHSLSTFRRYAMNNIKKSIPIEDGLWTIPSSPGEEPKLIGSKCPSCGELYFPRRKKGLCVHCQQTTLEDATFNGMGKIASFSIVEQAPAGGFYKGPVPYAYGDVNLIDGVILRSLFTGNLDKLRVGMDVRMVIEKLYDDDDGNEVVTYKFLPEQQ